MSREGTTHVVVDLDESLARINTFRLWSFRAFLVDGPTDLGDRLYAWSVFFSAYARRLLRLIDHTELRRVFVTSWGRRTRTAKGPDGATYNAQFADLVVTKYLDGQVLQLVEGLRRDDPEARVILATAAPEFYARRIAESLGVEVCATPITDEALLQDPSTPWTPNAGAAKLAAVETRLRGAAFVAVSDSSDDWPLIDAASAVYLVRPSESLLERSRALGKHITVIR